MQIVHDAEVAEPTGATAGGSLVEVYQSLRESILDGSLAAGEVLNQVALSRRLGVSRTPVREALRMLQAEGLVESQYQQRMRVTAVSAQEVDSVYATWLLVDALSVSLTVSNFTADDVGRLEGAFQRMVRLAGPESAALWEREHRAFHDLLILYASPELRASIASCWDRSERTRRTQARAAALSWHASDEEHGGLVEAYKARDAARAMHLTSRHLARTALSVIAHLDPAYEPRAIRQALAMVSSSK